MKQVVIDFTRAGFWNGAKHFGKGVVLYAAIGGLGYIAARVGGIHASTPEAMSIVVFVSELIQGASK